MQDLEWTPLVDGESEILVDDINKLAEYGKILNKNKVDKVNGKGLSTNDFTDEYKKQLDDGINIDVDIELSETSENPVANKVVTAELKKKVTAVNGKGLSSNDFTDDLKTRLENNTLSQTDLDKAIGDVETSLENIIAKYGLGGDGV